MKLEKPELILFWMFVLVALNMLKNYVEMQKYIINLFYRGWHNIDTHIIGWHIRYQHVEHVCFFSGTELMLCTKMSLIIVLS